MFEQIEQTQRNWLNKDNHFGHEEGEERIGFLFGILMKKKPRKLELFACENVSIHRRK